MERISKIQFEGGRIYMAADTGKIYSRPLEAFPALKEATDEQRAKYTTNKYGDAIRWPEIDEDIHISNFYETAEPEPDNAIARAFNRFPWLNVSEIARRIGIHKSLLSKYIYGTKKPSKQREADILDALREMGRELANI